MQNKYIGNIYINIYNKYISNTNVETLYDQTKHNALQILLICSC